MDTHTPNHRTTKTAYKPTILLRLLTQLTLLLLLLNQLPEGDCSTGLLAAPDGLAIGDAST